ncbi:cupin domain-containing protein [Streptomyces sp. NPDC057499]|uniref:cupin domain-containing protein n=1 Tax=Streptomyces sp. NPDC057499 TaxID=3346150 RepID=UPI0036B42AEF
MYIVEGINGTWATVTGVHGAAGKSGWRQLVPGRPLRGPWEGVELARLAPGGVSGLHRHTRTNEIYLVIGGEGELSLDGRTCPMPVGHMALTTLSSTHGIRNTGPGDFHWLVVEVPAAAALHPVTNPKESTDVTSPAARMHPVDLAALQHIDLRPFDAAPLLDAHYEQLDEDAAVDLLAENCEIFGYLVSGEATVSDADGSHALAAGVGVTLTLGEKAELRASSEATFFWVRSQVEGGEQ